MTAHNDDELYIWLASCQLKVLKSKNRRDTNYKVYIALLCRFDLDSNEGLRCFPTQWDSRTILTGASMLVTYQVSAAYGVTIPELDFEELHLCCLPCPRAAALPQIILPEPH